MNTNTQLDVKIKHTIEGDTEGWEGGTAALGLQSWDSIEHPRFRHKPKDTI